MQETPIRGRRLTRCLTIALLAVAAGAFPSCATQKPRTALISDPDSQTESSIPWNKPAKWESGANVPGGIGGGAAGGPGGTSINN
jgi:hypothetical protein